MIHVIYDSFLVYICSYMPCHDCYHMNVQIIAFFFWSDYCRPLLLWPYLLLFYCTLYHAFSTKLNCNQSLDDMITMAIVIYISLSLSMYTYIYITGYQCFWYYFTNWLIHCGEIFLCSINDWNHGKYQAVALILSCDIFSLLHDNFSFFI